MFGQLPPLELELELLLDDELLELELLEDELELLDEELLLDELEELLELLDELELLLDELLLELELLLDEELDVLPPGTMTVQLGASKLPSWFPWIPNVVLWPPARLPFQLQQLLTVTVEVLPPDITTFQPPVTLAGSLKPSSIVQPLIWLLPSLLTVTSIW